VIQHNVETHPNRNATEAQLLHTPQGAESQSSEEASLVTSILTRSSRQRVVQPLEDQPLVVPSSGQSTSVSGANVRPRSGSEDHQDSISLFELLAMAEEIGRQNTFVRRLSSRQNVPNVPAHNDDINGSMPREYVRHPLAADYFTHLDPHLARGGLRLFPISAPGESLRIARDIQKEQLVACVLTFSKISVVNNPMVALTVFSYIFEQSRETGKHQEAIRDNDSEHSHDSDPDGDFDPEAAAVASITSTAGNSERSDFSTGSLSRLRTMFISRFTTR